MPSANVFSHLLSSNLKLSLRVEKQRIPQKRFQEENQNQISCLQSQNLLLYPLPQSHAVTGLLSHCLNLPPPLLSYLLCELILMICYWLLFGTWHTSCTFQQLAFCSSVIFLLSGLDFSFTVITLCCAVLLILTFHFPACLSPEPQCSPSLTLTTLPLTPAALLVSHTTVLASSSLSHTTPKLKRTFTCWLSTSLSFSSGQQLSLWQASWIP